MSYSISYQQRAVNDYEQAVSWYKKRSKLASENFETSVDNRLEFLRADPARYKKRYKVFYEVAIKKYPFSILYIINEAERQVVISSIYHHRRNPKKKFWTLRMQRIIFTK